MTSIFFYKNSKTAILLHIGRCLLLSLRERHLVGQQHVLLVEGVLQQVLVPLGSAAQQRSRQHVARDARDLIGQLHAATGCSRSSSPAVVAVVVDVNWAVVAAAVVCARAICATFSNAMHTVLSRISRLKYNYKDIF